MDPLSADVLLSDGNHAIPTPQLALRCACRAARLTAPCTAVLVVGVRAGGFALSRRGGAQAAQRQITATVAIPAGLAPPRASFPGATPGNRQRQSGPGYGGCQQSPARQTG